MSKQELKIAISSLRRAGYSEAHIARYLFDNRTWLPQL